MAVGIYVTTSGFTTEKYNEAMSQLEAAGEPMVAQVQNVVEA